MFALWAEGVFKKKASEAQRGPMISGVEVTLSSSEALGAAFLFGILIDSGCLFLGGLFGFAFLRGLVGHDDISKIDVA